MNRKPSNSGYGATPKNRLRWALVGVAVLFLVALFVDLTGFKNVFATKVDQALSAVPVVNRLPVWPKLKVNTADGSRSLEFKSIKDIDLGEYGRAFSLGLDLLGGTHLVYDADVSNIDAIGRGDAMAGVRDVIERRVNALGVTEPLIQINQAGGSWRVIVELAGVYDVNQAIKIIGETPLLEFKEQNTESVSLTAEQQKALDDANASVKQSADEVLKKVLAGGDFASLAAEYSEDPGSRDNGGLYTGIKKGNFVTEYDDVIFNKLSVGQVYPQLVKTAFGYHIIKKEAERGTGDDREIDTRHILLAFKTATDLGIATPSDWKDTGLTGQQLKKATVEFNQNSNVPQVGLEFNSEGSDLFAQITARNVGKPVAIFLDGQPISVPQVNEPILSGKAVISSPTFTLKETKTLAQRLNAGALPVPIKLVSQTTVGASLGHNELAKSLRAGVWGLLLVALFMIIYYRLPGLLSVIALMIYTVLVLFVFEIIPVTLTLAGIAGFILSVGMAVDANILIFERTKEELKAGRDLLSAVNDGFNRAWSSIRDSNVSSLITCAILYWFGSSIIRGFALTLAIGIIISMFSAITITRQLLRLVTRWRFTQSSWLYNAGRGIFKK